MDVSQPTLTGRLVELRPLQAHHASALLQAAADGQLWNMTLTVVPGPDTMARYIATALEGARAGHRHALRHRASRHRHHRRQYALLEDRHGQPQAGN